MSSCTLTSVARAARPLFNISLRTLSASPSTLVKSVPHPSSFSLSPSARNGIAISYTPNRLSFSPMSTFASNNNNQEQADRPIKKEEAQRYHWVDVEARQLIKRAYAKHKALADKDRTVPPALCVPDLHAVGVPMHYPPQTTTDHIAHRVMLALRRVVHAFFGNRYDHHAVCLETVAAVPGIVASFHRHLRSLRRMRRDHGWITALQEEAENERMHLLILLKVVQPTRIERALVHVGQAVYLPFYSALYLLHSRAAHRLTGYLEEEALRAYTSYLHALESGDIPNGMAPNIAKQYYHLPDDATLKDVVLHIRADEAMHRDVNHQLALMLQQGKIDAPLHEEYTHNCGAWAKRSGLTVVRDNLVNLSDVLHLLSRNAIGVHVSKLFITACNTNGLKGSLLTIKNA